ncbi:metal ABC transporter permease [Helicobacter muridarum]|uniref:Metal ABC transporter permease n=1 Tax=Helicobacter muridarum TaxID=216 RepID=A0A4U8THD1_9HELI|nr:metal ABC transporter permease [Helicobacter muridarum]
MENTFLQYSIIAIILISIAAGIIGSLLVSNNIVFIGGGVAHCAYGGIGIAIFCGFSVLLGASLSALFVAFCLGFVKKYYSRYIDVFNSVLWAFGMALGVLFLNLSPQVGVDVESYLFGSIISIDKDLLWLIFYYNCFLVGFVYIYYKEILGISYDYEFCLLKNIKAQIFTNMIFIFIAIGIILCMQISGLILVLAILSIPAYIANLFICTLKAQMLFTSLLTCIFMLAGLYVAYRYNISPGASITLVSVFSMILILIIYKIRMLRG